MGPRAAHGSPRDLRYLLALLGFVALAGCSAGSVAVEHPAPEGDVAQACSDLIDALPDALEEGARRAVEPDSPYAAAYGDPAIVLRCGVERPAEFRPTSELVTINDVDWLPVERSGGVAFYAPGRVAWVRVDVPSAYTPGTFALTELSDVVVDLDPVPAESAASTSAAANSSALVPAIPAAPPA